MAVFRRHLSRMAFTSQAIETPRVETKRHFGPGRARDYSLALPQIRTCPIKAYGSSRHGFVCRRAIRERYGNRCPRVKALALVPAHGSATRHPLPSPGSARPAFPRLTGTMRCSDVLAPSRRASWCFAWRYRDGRLGFAPAGPVRRVPASREFVIRAPLPEMRRGEVRTSQGSQATLLDLCRVLRPRPDRTSLALMERRCCPRSVNNEGSSG